MPKAAPPTASATSSKKPPASNPTNSFPLNPFPRKREPLPAGRGLNPRPERSTPAKFLLQRGIGERIKKQIKSFPAKAGTHSAGRGLNPRPERSNPVQLLSGYPGVGSVGLSGPGPVGLLGVRVGGFVPVGGSTPDRRGLVLFGGSRNLFRGRGRNGFRLSPERINC